MPPTRKPATPDPPPDHAPPPDYGTSTTSVSRREFARRAALGTAALLAYPNLESASPIAAPSPDSHSSVASHSPVPTGPSPLLQTPQAQPAPPKLSPQSQAEADFRFQAILNQYPDRFSDAQKTDLRRLCVMLQPPLDRLRAYIISNGDLPALYLKPLVDREKKSAAPSAPGKSAASPGTKNSPAAAPAKPPKTDKP